MISASILWGVAQSEAIPEHLKCSPGHLGGVRAPFLSPFFVVFSFHFVYNVRSIFGLFVLLLWVIFSQRLSGGIFVNVAARKLSKRRFCRPADVLPVQ